MELLPKLVPELVPELVPKLVPELVPELVPGPGLKLKAVFCVFHAFSCFNVTVLWVTCPRGKCAHQHVTFPPRSFLPHCCRTQFRSDVRVVLKSNPDGVKVLPAGSQPVCDARSGVCFHLKLTCFRPACRLQRKHLRRMVWKNPGPETIYSWGRRRGRKRVMSAGRKRREDCLILFPDPPFS